MMLRSALYLLALASAPAATQQPGTANLYGSAKYQGAPLELTGPATHLGGMVVRSMKAPAGSSWELCSGNTFTGCKRFSGSHPGMVFVVRSARPAGGVIAASVEPPSAAAGAAGSGRSLRGLASEFFVEPAENGTRIEAPAGTGDGASAAATRFCLSHGWRASAYARVQAANGRTLLADVLCVDAEH